jgi:glutaredoxin-like YruB-family protein
MVRNKPRVRIYTTPACPPCLAAKTFLQKNGVEFVEISVASDREALIEMIEKSGQMSVPVLDIDGKIIFGFDRDAIKRALQMT